MISKNNCRTSLLTTTRLENVSIANALQLEAALPAFIMTPCQVWSRWTYPFYRLQNDC